MSANLLAAGDQTPGVQPKGITEQYQSAAGNALSFVLTAVADASSGSTDYTGTITGGGSNAFAGKTFAVAGFAISANNGSFLCTASTATTLTLSNAAGASETHAGTARTSATSGITPYDSGTILGNVPPGGAGQKLVSGVIQRSTVLQADATVGVVGNALVPTCGVGVVPVPPTGSLASDGLSLAPEHE